jgi:tol-pal system protein YbgF
MRCALVFAFLVLLVSPAHAGLFDDDEARKKLLAVEAEMRAKDQDTDARLTKLENSLKNLGLFELASQIEQLKQQLADMRGQMEVLSNQIATIDKKQRDFYLDLDSRLKRLEPGGAAGAADAAGSASAASSVPASTTALASTPAASTPSAASSKTPLDPRQTAILAAAEKRDYDAANALFKRGDYTKAIGAFQTFIDTYPASPSAASAQYWIGLAHYNVRNLTAAMSAQQTVLTRYPDSPKVPDAMLTIAAIQSDRGDAVKARQMLEDLVAKYPSSEAAGKARTRLAGPKR